MESKITVDQVLQGTIHNFLNSDFGTLISIGSEFMRNLEPKMEKINNEIANSINDTLMETISSSNTGAYIEEIDDDIKKVKSYKYQSKNSLRSLNNDQNIDKALNLVDNLTKKDTTTLMFLAIIIIGLVVLISVFKKKK